LQEKTLNKENAKGVGFLTSAGVLDILKHRFPPEKDAQSQAEGLPSLFVEERENPGHKRYIFDSFDRFTGYLTKFQETRKTFTTTRARLRRWLPALSVTSSYFWPTKNFRRQIP